MLASGAGAVATTCAGDTTAVPPSLGSVITSGGSFGAISNPVLSTGARSAGNLYVGSARDPPLAMISGVVVTGNFAAAAPSAKLLPPSRASWTLSTRSSSAALRLSTLSLAAISARAWSSDLPPCVLTESTFSTTQPKSDWTGPTIVPDLAANTAAAARSPATPA